MTKKNLKPKQAAPVQRENTATVARDGNAIAPRVQILLRATTRSNPHNSNTHLKKCQKSFSTCQGARFASMN
jgi:prenylated cyclic peptide (anacyclamide/piricyclamide family)